MVIGVALFGSLLAGCSSETGTVPEATGTTTTAPRETSSVVTAEPASPPVQPAESDAAETPEAVVPPAQSEPPVVDTPPSNRPTGEQLYAETCQQFITAIDALAATGAASREQAATGISDQLRANPSWSTLPPADQQEMLRGLDAAGRGSC